MISLVQAYPRLWFTLTAILLAMVVQLGCEVIAQNKRLKQSSANYRALARRMEREKGRLLKRIDAIYATHEPRKDLDQKHEEWVRSMGQWLNPDLKAEAE